MLKTILQKYQQDEYIRIWVPGCSTGQEAYSIAIAILEQADLLNSQPHIQIFATDIDERSIEKARSGIYPGNITKEVSKGRLNRHFVKVANGYQISNTIRDMCVFAVQNVIKDPPFSNLDLICCRNLMIYLGGELQKKVFQIFNYALKPRGFMMLGTSESIGKHADLFALVDRKSKLYTKKSIPSRIEYEFNPRVFRPDAITPMNQDKEQRAPMMNLQQEADLLVLDKYGPAGVVINQDMDIICFRGKTGPYFNPTPGVASLNLMKLVHHELSMELRAAVHKVRKDKTTVRKDNVYYLRNGDRNMVNIIVIPMCRNTVDAPSMLVLFEETVLPTNLPEPEIGKDTIQQTSTNVDQIKALEQELASTREYMQSIIEEHEGANEELKSANEEIQSTNEELQSTNEELETAKEELQSTNEELATVNEELEIRNIDLGSANNDLTNLLASINLPILILGLDLKIRQFTPQAEQLFNLIGTDLGRPISDIKPNIEIPDLETMLLEVTDTMTTKNIELKDKTGHWYSVRMRPYKTMDKRIAGTVLTFVDIDNLKDVERLQSTLDQERRLATIVRDSNDAITVQDFAGNIMAWNQSAARLYGYSEEQALKMSMDLMIPEEQRNDYLKMMTALRKGELVASFETQRISRDGSKKMIWLTATALINEQRQPYAIATTERELAAIKPMVE